LNSGHDPRQATRWRQGGLVLLKFRVQRAVPSFKIGDTCTTSVGGKVLAASEEPTKETKGAKAS